MTFYQELQLSSAGSKQLIKNTTDKKEKWRISCYGFLCGSCHIVYKIDGAGKQRCRSDGPVGTACAETG